MEIIIKFITTVLITLGYIALMAIIRGITIMLLWNWLLVDMFAFPEITIIEGWGIAFLSAILFKDNCIRKTNE